MNRTTSHPRAARLLAGSLLATFCLSGCGDPPAVVQPPVGPTVAEPKPTDVLLRIDGLEITFGEVVPHVAFLHSFAPQWASRVKFRRVLDEFTIPLHLARRAFPAQRQQMEERSRHLRSVATNAIELEQQGAQQVIKRKDLTRRSVELPLAAFLFDPLLTGSVSEPIEVPRGWVVASAYEVKQAALVLDDLVDSVQVGFLTHTPGDWSTWIDLEKHRVASKVTYVHPDYREYLPEWIQLP